MDPKITLNDTKKRVENSIKTQVAKKRPPEAMTGMDPKTNLLNYGKRECAVPLGSGASPLGGVPENALAFFRCVLRERAKRPGGSPSAQMDFFTLGGFFALFRSFFALFLHSVFDIDFGVILE